ncbi:MAG: hypothetical protein C4523_08060 [Myxococcales bacterium]|nr:MAG: hypothetical protein C4523_08060 [Myxococcales bacterium]
MNWIEPAKTFVRTHAPWVISLFVSIRLSDWGFYSFHSAIDNPESFTSSSLLSAVSTVAMPLVCVTLFLRRNRFSETPSARSAKITLLAALLAIAFLRLFLASGFDAIASQQIRILLVGAALYLLQLFATLPPALPGEIKFALRRLVEAGERFIDESGFLGWPSLVISGFVAFSLLGLLETIDYDVLNTLHGTYFDRVQAFHYMYRVKPLIVFLSALAAILEPTLFCVLVWQAFCWLLLALSLFLGALAAKNFARSSLAGAVFLVSLPATAAFQLNARTLDDNIVQIALLTILLYLLSVRNRWAERRHFEIAAGAVIGLLLSAHPETLPPCLMAGGWILWPKPRLKTALALLGSAMAAFCLVEASVCFLFPAASGYGSVFAATMKNLGGIYFTNSGDLARFSGTLVKDDAPWGGALRLMGRFAVPAFGGSIPLLAAGLILAMFSFGRRKTPWREPLFWALLLGSTVLVPFAYETVSFERWSLAALVMSMCISLFACHALRENRPDPQASGGETTAPPLIGSLLSLAIIGLLLASSFSQIRPLQTPSARDLPAYKKIFPEKSFWEQFKPAQPQGRTNVALSDYRQYWGWELSSARNQAPVSVSFAGRETPEGRLVFDGCKLLKLTTHGTVLVPASEVLSEQEDRNEFLPLHQSRPAPIAGMIAIDCPMGPCHDYFESNCAKP